LKNEKVSVRVFSGLVGAFVCVVVNFPSRQEEEEMQPHARIINPFTHSSHPGTACRP
jgi:hypothetical protein